MTAELGAFPFDGGFQARVFAACLIDRRFYAWHRPALRPAHYTEAPLRDFAELLEAFYERHRAVPSVDGFRDVVEEALERRRPKAAVADLWRRSAAAVAAVAPGDVAYAKARVLDWARTQALANAAMRVADLYEAARRTGEAKDGELQAVFLEAAEACRERRGDHLDYFGDLVQRTYADPNTFRVPTGYPTLDDALEGGVDRGEYLLFVGTPSLGKTSLLVGAARGMLMHRYKPLVVSLEVSARRWAWRVDRAATGRSRGEIMDDPRGTIRLVRRLRQVQGAMKIKWLPAGQATVADIEGTIEELKDSEGFVPDALIVDYADELRSSVHGDDFRLNTIQVGRELRSLGARHDIPVLSASQAGRQAEGKAVTGMRDAAEAYGKNFVADVVITLNQVPEEAAFDPPVCRLHGAKVREGARGFTLPYVFRPERGIIQPADADTVARMESLRLVVTGGAPDPLVVVRSGGREEARRAGAPVPPPR